MDKNYFLNIGDWNDWEDSSDCYFDALDGQYRKSQERTCKSGICDGPTSQWIVCDPINGDWTDWSEYTECKIGSTCPEDYPNAYVYGYWCCKYDSDGDGSTLNKDSSTCYNDEYLVCSNGDGSKCYNSKYIFHKIKFVFIYPLKL